RRHLRAPRAVEPHRQLSRAGDRPLHRLHRLTHGDPEAYPSLSRTRPRAGVLSGGVFAFIHSFDEVIITMFISGVHVQTLPLKMWEDIRNQIDPTIAAVSSMLILLPVVWLIVLEVAHGLNRAAAAPVGTTDQA